MKNAKLKSILPVTLLSAVALAGCSVGGGGNANPNGTQSGGSGSPTQTSSTTKVGAISDLQKNECVEDNNGVWNFNGSVKNTGKKEATYSVRADITNLTGNASLVNKMQDYRLKPGEAKNISIKNLYKKTSKSPKKIGCVITVTKTENA